MSSLTTALSALRHHQVAMDVASGNIANADTDGYSRRRAVAETAATGAVAALWSRSEPTGSGVRTGAVDRINDAMLDARARTEHALSQRLETRGTAMARIEASTGEPGDRSLSKLLGAFSGSWGDLANNPGSTATRGQVLAAGRAVASAANLQARALDGEWSSLRAEADSLVQRVNGLATELAGVNRSLTVATSTGTDTATLLDQRDRLTLGLAQLSGAATHHEADGTATVTLGGRPLVSGQTSTALAVTGATVLADATTTPVAFTVGGEAATVSEGSLGGVAQLLREDLPAHLAALDAAVAGIAEAVNALHEDGFDPDGTAGAPFFSGTTAATLTVAVTDPARLAATSDPAGGLDNDVARAIGGLDLGRAYHAVVTTLGSTVSSLRGSAATQATLVSHVDATRESISGVNVDEETVDLIAAQRAYEAASRVLSVMDQVLDTLINRTGIS